MSLSKLRLYLLHKDKINCRSFVLGQRQKKSKNKIFHSGREGTLDCKFNWYPKFSVRSKTLGTIKSTLGVILFVIIGNVYQFNVNCLIPDKFQKAIFLLYYNLLFQFVFMAAIKLSFVEIKYLLLRE